MKNRKLDLKIIPALVPLLVGVLVALLVLGDHIFILLTSFVAGYFASLVASILIELISWLKKRQ